MLILFFSSSLKEKNSHVEHATVAVDREIAHCQMVGMPRKKKRIRVMWK